ncbi:MAG: S49 family peptidase [Taibaiella sp.]|nr:S49 family peptidase [Taibaiella sp.]
MDIRTGLAIYNKPWLVEPQAAAHMLELWERVKRGEMTWNWRGINALEDDEDDDAAGVKATHKFFSSLGKDVVLAPENTRQMAEFKGFDGAKVAVIPVQGALMKADFCGWFGTGKMRSLVTAAARTKSVNMILLDMDTPGGTVDGTQAFADIIRSASAVYGKRTVALNGGMICSAGMWIASGCDEIFTSSATDITGSIGTMCSLVDRSKYQEDMGIVVRDYYATESVDKNKEFSEAVKGDGRLLVQQTLDPMNNVFTGAVKANRGERLKTDKENVLTGKTYLADKAQEYGLTDGMADMEGLIEEGLKGNKKSKTILTIKKEAKMEGMTLQELKNQHPAAYEAAVKEGVAAERERVTAALTYGKVDMETTMKLIKSGEPITETFRAEMWEKTMNQKTLEGMQGSNKTVATEAVATENPEKGAEEPKEPKRTEAGKTRVERLAQRNGWK